MIPLYIFDLDGTLADCAHRRYLTEGDGMHWPSFYRSCVTDKPNWPVIRTFHLLAADADAWIWSGRIHEVREHTLDWLEEHVNLTRSHLDRVLRVRPPGDSSTPDDTLKRSWLEGLPAADRERLVAVFDDRDRVVRMWRSQGVPCFQVAPGDF